MDASAALGAARTHAGLSQAELAERAGTSQATISAYETGAKQPSVATFSRLLAATGTRLTVEYSATPVVEPSPNELEQAGETLAQVIALPEALPVEHDDWADLEAMAERGTLDLDAVGAQLKEMLDRDDGRFERLGALRDGGSGRVE